MQKSGIITFHRTTNFGSCLQTYGLCKAIEQLGIEYELIDYRCPAIENREGISFGKQWSLKNVMRGIIYQPFINKKYTSLMSFLNSKVKISRPYSPGDILEANNYYNSFLVGSDIVWGTDITLNDYNYFLEFAEDDKTKVAFASSVGSYDLQDSDRKGQLLARFDQIAVRERAATEWVYNISGKKADWVCDPTMLLKIEDWDEAVRPKQYKSDYVLVYFTDDQGKCLEDAKNYARKHGLKVCHIDHSIRRTKGIHKVRPTSLREFLGLLRNAQAVFTASYHGMLFAMYYHKELWFYTRAHSDRMLALAEKVGIVDHCGSSMSVGCCSPIDYEQVDKKMQAFREDSIAILKGMLQA